MKDKTIRAICGLVFFISGFVNAETLSEALASCQSNDDSLQRLVCYDKLAKNVKSYDKADRVVGDTSSASANQKETSSAAVAKSNPPQQQTSSQPVESASSTVSTFGMEQRQEEEADRIDAKVAEVSEGVRGEMIITLDSGMVWRQITSEAGIKLEVGQEIYVEKGMLGSFYLSYEDINRRIKVKRIK